MSNYRQKEETRFPYSRLLSAIYRPDFFGLSRASNLAIVGGDFNERKGERPTWHVNLRSSTRKERGA